MAIILLVKTEDGAITELPVLERMVIGRSSSSDLKVNDIKMSGSHCSFEITSKGQLLFKDLGSTNGSLINNTQVHQIFLHMNDVIKVGNTEISVDVSKLNPSEKILLGVTTSPHKPGKENTLPQLTTMTSTKTHEAEIAKASPREVVKKVKVQQPAKNWSNSEGEIEQEASTGFTRFLEIVTNKKKKKK